MKKDKVYSEMAQKFFQALADPENKGNLKKCMRLAGYSENTSTKEIISMYSDEIIDIANKLMAAHTVQATMGIISVIGEPDALGARNIVSAAREVLDRAGIVKKAEESINLKVPGGGLLILPAKNGEVSKEDEE